MFHSRIWRSSIQNMERVSDHINSEVESMANEPTKPQFEAFIRVPLWVNKDEETGEQQLNIKLFGQTVKFRKLKKDKE